MSSTAKPRVIVLGGLGNIGRSFVKYLIDNECCAAIRVVDKMIPDIANLSPEFETAIAATEFVQGDLSRDDHVARAFRPGADGAMFDIVVNLAAETRYGMPESAYQQKCLELSTKCGTAAKAHGVRHFIEVSTAYVYKSQSKRPAPETAEVKPWTMQATFKYQAEEALRAIEGLPLTIVRPALVYGPGDVHGIMPRVVCAVVYKRLGEPMKLLWDKSTRLNTVHVRDAARALWHIATNVAPRGEVFNLADKGDTDQGKLSDILGRIFDIRTGFYGTIISNVAKLRLTDAAEEANEKHLKPWTELLKEFGIEGTPLSPYVDVELLRHNHLFVDGSKIEATGFSYEVPTITEEAVREMVESYVRLNVLPAPDRVAPVAGK